MSGFCNLSSDITMEEPAIRQGVYVTAGYVLVFYACVIGQANAKWKISASYRARGERVGRLQRPPIRSSVCTACTIHWGVVFLRGSACSVHLLYKHITRPSVASCSRQALASV